MEKVDKNGMTEKEFLESYDDSMFDKPSLTADTILFAVKDERPVLLLIKRGGFPFMDDWAFPGGFVNNGESVEQAAARELFEEAGIKDVSLEQIYTVSTPNRDPRAWVVTVCFMGILEQIATQNAGDDASEARWFNIDYAAKDDLYELVLKSDDVTVSAVMDVKRLPSGKIDINETQIVLSEGLAFDHAKLILYALENL